MVSIGCEPAPRRMSKKTFEKFEMVYFGLILGGDVITLGIVSRMDVRDARIELSLIVVSQ